jgi:hypothetical protein
MGWRGFGFVHHSRALFCRAVPNPNITIRNFFHRRTMRLFAAGWPTRAPAPSVPCGQCARGGRATPLRAAPGVKPSTGQMQNSTPFGRRGLRVAKQGYLAPNDHGGAGSQVAFSYCRSLYVDTSVDVFTKAWFTLVNFLPDRKAMCPLPVRLCWYMG